MKNQSSKIMVWEIDKYGSHVVRGKHCWIWINERPQYCDRGNWLAHLEVNPDYAWKVSIDHSDGWPRYYFDLERAKLEVEAWLTKRQQALTPQ
jgi:hypothetical protein